MDAVVIFSLRMFASGGKALCLQRGQSNVFSPFSAFRVETEMKRAIKLIIVELLKN